ncbi:MAG: hypothetical protein M1536_06350 [Firmicutes bacterium]|nr:hypothetical protein [Bacillota bacterium]
MANSFELFTTPGFERDIKRMSKKNPSAIKQIHSLISFLKIDPYFAIEYPAVLLRGLLPQNKLARRDTLQSCCRVVYNSSSSHDIKKLTAVEHGEGQFRIRSGNYRLRYDIFGKNVVLYSARDRKEAY